jgi:hypothetical protein
MMLAADRIGIAESLFPFCRQVIASRKGAPVFILSQFD